jgi:hypothetical protein
VVVVSVVGLEELCEVDSCFEEGGVVALRVHLSSVEEEDLVGRLEELELVRDQDPRLVLQYPADTLVVQVTANLCVHGGEGVVQEVHVSVTVHRSGNSRTLTFWVIDVDLEEEAGQIV